MARVSDKQTAKDLLQVITLNRHTKAWRYHNGGKTTFVPFDSASAYGQSLALNKILKSTEITMVSTEPLTKICYNKRAQQFTNHGIDSPIYS